jgi:hypothetical protein
MGGGHSVSIREGSIDCRVIAMITFQSFVVFGILLACYLWANHYSE